VDRNGSGSRQILDCVIDSVKNFVIGSSYRVSVCVNNINTISVKSWIGAHDANSCNDKQSVKY
jgi:hypothetical protein